MRKSISLFIAVTLFTTLAEAKREVAFTIDDAPLGQGTYFSGKVRTQKLIDVLAAEGVTTTFYCNSERLGVNDGAERLRMYAKAGHAIANHTHNHLSINKVPTERYIQQIDDADKALSQFPGFTKSFRYPYLHEGRSLETRDPVRKHLAELGYTNAYVTVDTYDYAIEDFIARKQATKNIDLEKACKFLEDLTMDGLGLQERWAKKYLKKDVRQVVLMHENDLEARCLAGVIKKVRAAGWTIVTPQVAFDDESLKAEPDSLWLEKGRIAAYANAKNPKLKLESKWESSKTLEAEMNRRGIALDPKK